MVSTLFAKPICVVCFSAALSAFWRTISAASAPPSATAPTPARTMPAVLVLDGPLPLSAWATWLGDGCIGGGGGAAAEGGAAGGGSGVGAALGGAGVSSTSTSMASAG